MKRIPSATSNLIALVSLGLTLGCDMESRPLKPLDVRIVLRRKVLGQPSEHILFMEFAHLTDVDALSDATIAWAWTNVHEGTRD